MSFGGQKLYIKQVSKEDANFGIRIIFFINRLASGAVLRTFEASNLLILFMIIIAFYPYFIPLGNK